jgi:serine/threonine protein kinase
VDVRQSRAVELVWREEAPPPLWVGIVHQLSKAVEYLGRRTGLVNIDLKPGNVLFREASGGFVHCLLTDFGICRPSVNLITDYEGTGVYLPPTRQFFERWYLQRTYADLAQYVLATTFLDMLRFDGLGLSQEAPFLGCVWLPDAPPPTKAEHKQFRGYDTYNVARAVQSLHARFSWARQDVQGLIQQLLVVLLDEAEEGLDGYVAQLHSNTLTFTRQIDGIYSSEAVYSPLRQDYAAYRAGELQLASAAHEEARQAFAADEPQETAPP